MAFALTGCEQLEQAANDTINQTKQTAAQALYEARQSASIDKAEQSADPVLQVVRQQDSDRPVNQAIPAELQIQGSAPWSINPVLLRTCYWVS